MLNGHLGTQTLSMQGSSGVLLTITSRYMALSDSGALESVLATLSPVRARYSLDGYDPKESPALAGMAERKDRVWVGAAVEWSPGIADFSLEYLTDATDKSGGSTPSAVPLSVRAGVMKVVPPLCRGSAALDNGT